MNKEKTYRILFVGNSYTFFNGMPDGYFREIAERAGYKVEIDTVLRGGWTLEKHADVSDEFGAKVDAALKGDSYDYVILQEMSVRPAVDAEPFFAAVRNLNQRIRANGASPVLYSTWGRKPGSKKLDEIGMTNEQMTRALARSYRDIGFELDIPVAYVGLAFFEIGDRIELYDPDKTHPSAEGSYLAALTLFLRIFGDEETLSDCAFSPDIAQTLKTAARNAVFRTPDMF